MDWYSKTAFAVIAVALSGCSRTLPVAVMGGGQILKGEATGTISGGSFTVRDTKTSCAGTFDAGQTASFSLAAKCSDGRAGIGSGFRDSYTGGSGEIQMSDGSKARFIFGPQADAL